MLNKYWLISLSPMYLTECGNLQSPQQEKKKSDTPDN